MYPRNITKINRPGIELLITTVTLTNDFVMQLILLYRSPSVPMQSLINVMIMLFNNIDLLLPTLVIGDFNEDLTDSETCSNRFLKFMMDNRFKQFVMTPTTDRGTMIDHVYGNVLLGNITSAVTDCYYSDHDIVFSTITDAVLRQSEL